MMSVVGESPAVVEVAVQINEKLKRVINGSKMSPNAEQTTMRNTRDDGRRDSNDAFQIHNETSKVEACARLNKRDYSKP